MPKKCRLPAYDYGAVGGYTVLNTTTTSYHAAHDAGAMGFFQMRLKDVMMYRDLQTEVRRDRVCFEGSLPFRV